MKRAATSTSPCSPAGVAGVGYGRALGQFIAEDGATLPQPADLEDAIRREPAHPLAAARAELLAAMREHGLPAGPLRHAAPLERGLDPGCRLPP